MSAALFNAAVQAGMVQAENVWDDKGYTSHHWLLPERGEIIYSGLASLIIFALLYKFTAPMIKKAFAARTERIQGELDAAAAARTAAQSDAGQIRQSLGNIDAERQRLLADAEAQAEALLADGRVRLQAEAVELEAKADAELAAVGGRSSDELRGQITRFALAASEQVVVRTVDAATQQRLIEEFITKVGASAS